MNKQAKSWIDYIVDDLRSAIGPLDEKQCVVRPDFDTALRVAQINCLVNLRERMDGKAPEGYGIAQHAYMHDADMQRLRLACNTKM